MSGARKARWFYFIPHRWEEDTTFWEDIWLILDVPEWKTDSLWLTVSTLGGLSDEERKNAEEELGGAEFRLYRDHFNLTVRRERMNLAELLEWTQVALREVNLPCDELVEGTHEMFAGSNEHARHLEEAAKLAKEMGLE